MALVSFFVSIYLLIIISFMFFPPSFVVDVVVAAALNRLPIIDLISLQ